MGIERERKFLVAGNSWRRAVTSATELKQGYVTTTETPSVRIRVKGGAGVITIKGGRDPLHRLEFEWGIPYADAEEILDQICTKPLVEKVRHEITAADGFLWEIDEFRGHLTGLVLAEVELPAGESSVSLPDWIGEEVTHDPKYLNSNLAKGRP